jgi:uncharacterized protein YraI
LLSFIRIHIWWELNPEPIVSIYDVQYLSRKEGIEMKTKFFIISLFFLLFVSACTANPVLENLPPAEAPAEVPVSASATTELVVVNTDTPAPLETQSTEEAQPVVEMPATVDTGPLDDEAFDIRLAQAIEGKNLEAVKSMMGDRFAFLLWNTELRDVASAEAFDILRQEHLVGNAQPAVIFGTDVVTLLDGVDPLVQWGPAAQPVRAFYAMGLGPNAADEAVFVVAEDEDGTRYLHGIILPPGGYFQAYDQDDRVVKTDVKIIQAEANVRMRTGPGFEYAQEDLLYEGQIALVTGLSKDGAWWRVVCETDASGYCFVSADPALTTPIRSSQAFDMSDDRVAATDVQYIQAQANVRMRTGPGFEYAQEGLLYEGQIALVTGISRDAAWWRIVCEMDASGACWISADPSLTKPATLP